MVSEERLTSTEGLKIGDVIVVATKTRKGHWWRRFAVVVEHLAMRDYIHAYELTLDMSMPVMITADIEIDSVYLVPVEQWPEGVSAMYAKALAKGWIKLG